MPTTDGYRTIDAYPPSRWRRFAQNRFLRLGLMLLGALVLLAVGWVLVTGLIARSQVSAAERSLTQLRSAISAGNLDAATAAANDVGSHAHRAHELTTGPAWWLTAGVPWLGEPLDSVRGCAAQADSLGAHALKPLVSVAKGLDPSQLVSNGTVRLGPLVAAAPAVNQAQVQVAASTRAVDALPARTWLGAVNDARSSLLTNLQQLTAQLTTANRAVTLLPDMLGESGTRRYFVGLENEAESRGIGGLPGAFVIVTAQHGTLSFTRFESDTTLTNVQVQLDLGADFQQRYGSQPTTSYGNSDISPDFRDAAQIWAAMWQKYSGQHVDGAVAVDPTALGYLLAVTGPTNLPDGTTVSGADVAALTQKTLYAKFTDTEQRKAYLLDIARAIADKLTHAGGSSALLHAIDRAAGERRLLIYSGHPNEEAQLLQSSLSGALIAGNRPFTGFTVVNAAGSKLDYYLERSMTYTSNGCGPVRQTTATFTLTNAVPAGTLPVYVTTRADNPSYPTRPGDNKLLVSYYSTPGSVIKSVTVNGATLAVTPQTEKGLVVFTVSLELPRDTSATVDVTLTEPARAGAVQVLNQPLVNPMSVDIKPSCS